MFVREERDWCAKISLSWKSCVVSSHSRSLLSHLHVTHYENCPLPWKLLILFAFRIWTSEVGLQANISMPYSLQPGPCSWTQSPGVLRFFSLESKFTRSQSWSSSPYMYMCTCTYPHTQTHTHKDFQLSPPIWSPFQSSHPFQKPLSRETKKLTKWPTVDLPFGQFSLQVCAEEQKGIILTSVPHLVEGKTRSWDQVKWFDYRSHPMFLRNKYQWMAPSSRNGPMQTQLSLKLSRSCQYLMQSGLWR